MPEPVDGIAGHQRPDGVRDREAERQPAEIQRALLERAGGAEYAVHRDVHVHEGHAEQRGGEVKDFQEGKSEGQGGGEGERAERQQERAPRAGAVDQAPGAHRQHRRQQREQRHQHAGGELRGAELEREQRGGHPRADEGEVAERIQDYEGDDFQLGLQTVMATPAQVTAMPASASALGTTPNQAASSTTANTGGRYIMLVTRVAPPWRSR